MEIEGRGGGRFWEGGGEERGAREGRGVVGQRGGGGGGGSVWGGRGSMGSVEIVEVGRA